MSSTSDAPITTLTSALQTLHTEVPTEQRAAIRDFLEPCDTSASTTLSIGDARISLYYLLQTTRDAAIHLTAMPHPPLLNPTEPTIQTPPIPTESAQTAPSLTLFEHPTVRGAQAKLLTASNPAELIGSFFEHVTSSNSRHQLGQYCTPTRVANLMAAWVARRNPQTILDPGTGAGALLHALLDNLDGTVQDAEIHGVDISPLACVMSATTLTLRDATDCCTIHNKDFILDDAAVPDGVDTIIGNPPYTRHHEIPDTYKRQINDQIESETGRQISALSPLYAYWLYHSIETLQPGGQAVFLTPSGFLETAYGEDLKQYLLDETTIQAFVQLNPSGESIFETADATAMLTLLDKPIKATSGTSTESVRFIRADNWPGQRALLNAITSDSIENVEWGMLNNVDATTLCADDPWTKHFEAQKSLLRTIDTDRLCPLRELADVKRGIVTGQNDYYCLNDADVNEFGIDETYLTPILRSLGDVSGVRYDTSDWQDHRKQGKQVWLLFPPEDAVPILERALADLDANPTEMELPGILAYLQHGRSDQIGAHCRYTAENRNPWFRVARREPPAAFLPYIIRDGFDAIHNAAGVRYLSNTLGLYPTATLNQDDLLALLAYLNSDVAATLAAERAREHTRGMQKIEPSTAEEIPVLDPRLLTDTETAELADAFYQLSNKKQESTIETTIAKIL